jgi:hypothetical protein
MKRLIFSESARMHPAQLPASPRDGHSVTGVSGRVFEMRAKPVTAKKCKQAFPRRREARTLLSRLNQRLISDFELETQDFAFLCLLASASRLIPGLEGCDEQDDEVPYLTFH